MADERSRIVVTRIAGTDRSLIYQNCFRPDAQFGSEQPHLFSVNDGVAWVAANKIIGRPGQILESVVTDHVPQGTKVSTTTWVWHPEDHAWVWMTHRMRHEPA